MTDLSDLPPDPFAEDGVDEFAVEASEALARENVDPADPRWDRIGGEPTIDDFDEAAHELRGCDADANAEPCGTGPFTRLLPWMSAIAIIVVIALVILYGLR